MEPSYTVLIMAANRHGINNRIARLGGTTHKCVVPVAEVPMIERVVRTVEDWGRAKRVIISIENPAVLDGLPYLDEQRAKGWVEIRLSGLTLTDSVFAACDDMQDADYPLLITTGDNVLHTVEILQAFAAKSEASDGDAILGLTPRTLVEEHYPEDAAIVGYIKFADGEHSNCNFYILKNSRVLPMAAVMRQGGQFRHHPKRILKVFGLVAMVKFVLGMARIQDVPRRLQRKFGVKLDPVMMPFAEAPIDVDTAHTYVLADRILRQREGRPPSNLNAKELAEKYP